MILGNRVRFHQNRVRRDSCTLYQQIKGLDALGETCQDFYSITSESTDPYGPASDANATATPGFVSNPPLPSSLSHLDRTRHTRFVFVDTNKTMLLLGDLALYYSINGFIVDLDTSNRTAWMETLKTLQVRRSRWDGAAWAASAQLTCFVRTIGGSTTKRGWLACSSTPSTQTRATSAQSKSYDRAPRPHALARHAPRATRRIACASPRAPRTREPPPRTPRPRDPRHHTPPPHQPHQPCSTSRSIRLAEFGPPPSSTSSRLKPTTPFSKRSAPSSSLCCLYAPAISSWSTSSTCVLGSKRASPRQGLTDGWSAGQEGAWPPGHDGG